MQGFEHMRLYSIYHLRAEIQLCTRYQIKVAQVLRKQKPNSHENTYAEMYAIDW